MPINEAFIRAADVARTKIREKEERLAALLREAKQVEAEIAQYQVVVDIAEEKPPVIASTAPKGNGRPHDPRIDFGPIVRGEGFTAVEELLKSAETPVPPKEIHKRLEGSLGRRAPSQASIYNYLTLGVSSGVFLRVGHGLYVANKEGQGAG